MKFAVRNEPEGGPVVELSLKQQDESVVLIMNGVSYDEGRGGGYHLMVFHNDGTFERISDRPDKYGMALNKHGQIKERKDRA